MRRAWGALLAVVRSRWRSLGLRQQLFLLFIAFSLGPLLLSNVWGYLVTRTQMADAALRDLANVAALEASQTLEFVRDKRSLVLSLVAGNQHLYERLRSLHHAERTDERRRLEQALSRHLAAKVFDAQAAEEFEILSPVGALLSSSRFGRRAGRDLSQSACYRAARSGPTVAGFEYGADEMTLLVGAPIRETGGALLGVFCARFRFEIHRMLVAASNERTPNAVLYLLDEKGRIVSGSFADIRRAPLGQQIRLRGRGLVGGSQSWKGEHRSDAGEVTLSAYAPIPELGWGVFVEVPKAQALASLEQLGRLALVLSVALAACLAVVLYVAARALARPLKALSDAADRVARGALGESVPSGGAKELDELARSFNQMSLALKESHDLLEERIRERTAALQTSHEFTELLLNSLDQRIVVLDRQLRIVKANRAALRLHGEDLVGKGYAEAFGGDAECGDCPALRSFTDARPSVAERSQTTRAGTEIFRLESFPVLSPRGEVEVVIEIGRVITAEKRREAQLIHQEKMAALGLLTAGIAHEIGNPLASIQSQLRMTRQFPEPDRVEKTLAIVEREVERIDRLLRELVSFARRRRDEVTLVAVNQVVGDVARLLSHDPRARNVRIELQLSPNLPGVKATEDHLVQVLLNLGINALDAMPDGGSLTFETAVENGMLAVRLRDTGGGMGPEVQAQLFEPFFTTKGPGRGTGLGLFVSRSIVAGMGGSVELERSGPDGSVFVVRLPVGKDVRHE